MPFPRRILICLLSLIAIIVLLYPVSILTANYDDDDCTPCARNKPNGFISTDLGPALYSGERIWNPQSLALVAESQLLDITTWRLVADAALAEGRKDISLSDLMAGRFILVKLYLHPTTALITPEQIFLENSAGHKLLPKQVVVNGLSNMYHAILVYEKTDVLSTGVTWLKVWLTAAQNCMYFSFTVRPTP